MNKQKPNKGQAMAFLRMAFAALPAAQRAMLRKHAKAKTPIFCGRDAHKWEKLEDGLLVKG